jgi:hypothetical protein
MFLTAFALATKAQSLSCLLKRSVSATEQAQSNEKRPQAASIQDAGAA